MMAIAVGDMLAVLAGGRGDAATGVSGDVDQITRHSKLGFAGPMNQ